MSWIHNGKNRNPEKPISGCLGRMVNLFDLNTAVGGNRLLTDKPHHDGSSFSRRQSDVSRTTLFDDHMDDNKTVSELRKSPSNRKSNGTPIKMLIAQEMSKEEDCKQSPSNLVAKLMGLDALPQQQPGSASCRSQMRESRSQSGSMEFLQQEHGCMDTRAKHEISQQGEYKEGYEMWQQHCEPEYVRDDLPHKGRCSERQIESKMALVREKFMEAKRLSTDEKLRQSKQFQDALEVLSSNKDLFLKFLQEPNSLFSQHLYNLQSVPPPPDSRRITVLRPSKLVDSHKITGLKNEKQVKETVQMGLQKAWDKNTSDFLFSPECCNFSDNPTQPTRIVVLKPSSVKPHNNKVIASPPSLLGTSHDVFDRDPEDIETLESRQVAEEITGGLRRDETLLSSVFSNGYIGDDSSFGKSEIDFAAGNLSDSEVVSPTSRHSWDYVNRFNSHYYTSSSRTSYSPESSVCREAKKRLSERWAMMASNKSVVLEQRQIQRSSSTLGDMLALSDLKKSVKSDENHESKEEYRGSLLFMTSDMNKVEDADDSHGNLSRSKSVPASATSSGSRLSVEVSGSSKFKADDMKERLVKSSLFKGRVSSLFFSKNKKSSKEKSLQSKDVPQSAKIPIHSSRHTGNEEPHCINELVVEEESSTRLHRSQRKSSDKGSSYAGLKRGIILPEVGFSFTKTEIPGSHSENQDQPSPISVLERQFEEDDRMTDCHCNQKLKAHGIEPMRCNLIDKSPPIGSIARTLTWDDSVLGSSSPYAGKPPLNPEEEEQECLFYVESLLSVAGLNKMRSNSFLSKWHSPESPLDPSLRDKYMNLSEKQPILIQMKRRHQRAIAKLVFDCVNEALVGIAGRGPCSSVEDMAMSSSLLKDHVWAQMKEWLSGEERGDWEDVDGGSMVVERVVMKEVVGRGWVEGFRLEIDNTRKEIEGKLLEDLVDESVLELTGRA